MFKIISTQLEGSSESPCLDLFGGTALTAVKKSFQCPITLAELDKPVIMEDRKAYEFTAIQQWLHTNSTSPMTRGDLSQSPYIRSLDFEKLHHFYKENPLHTRYPNFEVILDRVTKETSSPASFYVKGVLEALKAYWDALPPNVLIDPPESPEMDLGYSLECLSPQYGGGDSLRLFKDGVSVLLDAKALSDKGYRASNLMENSTEIINRMIAVRWVYNDSTQFSDITSCEADSYEDAIEKAKQRLSEPITQDIQPGDSFVYQYTKRGKRTGMSVTRYLVLRYEEKQTKGWKLGVYSVGKQDSTVTLSEAIQRPKRSHVIDEQENHINDVLNNLHLVEQPSNESSEVIQGSTLGEHDLKALMSKIPESLSQQPVGSVVLTKLFCTPEYSFSNSVYEVGEIYHYSYAGAIIYVVVDENCVSGIYVPRKQMEASVDFKQRQSIPPKKEPRSKWVSSFSKKCVTEITPRGVQHIKTIIRDEFESNSGDFLARANRVDGLEGRSSS